MMISARSCATQLYKKGVIIRLEIGRRRKLHAHNHIVETNILWPIRPTILSDAETYKSVLPGIYLCRINRKGINETGYIFMYRYFDLVTPKMWRKETNIIATVYWFFSFGPLCWKLFRVKWNCLLSHWPVRRACVHKTHDIHPWDSY